MHCQKKRTKNSIAITGMGIVSPFGVGLSSFEHALRNTSCCINRSNSFPELNFSLLSSEINHFNLESALDVFALTKKQMVEFRFNLIKESLGVQTAVVAAIEAHQQAQLSTIPAVPSNRMGVIIAGGNLSQLQQWIQFQKHTKTPLAFAKPSWAIQFFDSYLLSVISELFKLQGPGITTSAASASSHAALMQASQWIQLDVVDICFVVSGIAEFSGLEWQALMNAGALGGHSFADTPELACRPFDNKHEGFIPGQAAACVILESERSSVQRNVDSQGQLLSVAMRLDGTRLPEPNLDGEIKVMQDALSQAGIHPSKITYINAHGTSTPKGDLIELEAINTVFHDKTKQPWINSTKGIMGHCLWSAGIVEMIATSLQMKYGFLHGNRNLENPINLHARLVGRCAHNVPIEYALSNAFGFGGINSSLILKSGS